MQGQVGQKDGGVFFLSLWHVSFAAGAWRLVVAPQGSGAFAARQVLLDDVTVVAPILTGRSGVLSLELRKLSLCLVQKLSFSLFFLFDVWCPVARSRSQIEFHPGALQLLLRLVKHVWRRSRQPPFASTVACFAFTGRG